MAKNPTIPSREVLKRTLENSGSDFPLDELEAIYAEFARQFEEEAKLPIVESQRGLSPDFNMVESFLGQVHKAMKRDGVTASELARRLGVSRAWVSKALSGDAKNFQLATIAKLACALDLDVSVVLETPNSEQQIDDSRIVSVVEMLSASQSASRHIRDTSLKAASVQEFPRVPWTKSRPNDNAQDEGTAYGS